MQHLEVGGAIRRIYRSLGFKGLSRNITKITDLGVKKIPKLFAKFP